MARPSVNALTQRGRQAYKTNTLHCSLDPPPRLGLISEPLLIPDIPLSSEGILCNLTHLSER